MSNKESIMKKIVLSVITFILVLSSVSFANCIGDISMVSNAKCVTDYSDNTSVSDMDSVTFGSYPQSDASGNTKEPIEWIVLEKNNNEVLLLSKYILDCKCYNEEYKDITWETCTLREWSNDTFYNKAFDGNEKKSIIKSKVVNKDNSRYGTSGGNDTNDYVYLLSRDECKKYFGSDEDGRRDSKNLSARGTEYAKNVDNHNYTLNVSDAPDEWFDGNSTFWLRSPGDVQRRATRIVYSGSFASGTLGNADNCNFGFRPLIRVSLNNNTRKDSNTIKGLPSVQSEYRNDGHFYLNNNMQKSTWVYYVTYYYHVDGAGNIEKSKWIEQRYVGSDGRMYRGRQTPDGKWVGDDGLVVNVSQDLSHSLTIEAAEPDSWYKTQSGLWYYFENDRTTTKKGWFTDTRDNQTYYLDPSTGIMAVGWTTINGSQYYFNESHDNVNNWYETGGGFYESYGKKTKAYGSMFKNEKTPDGHQVDANGKKIN